MDNTFSLDTTKIPSDTLGGTTTPKGVLQYRNTLADQFNQQYADYQHTQAPLQNQLVQSTQFSPDYMGALNKQRMDNQAYIQGSLNIRNKVIPLEYATGQQQQLALQHSFDQQANSENLNYLENFRKNNIDTTQAQIGLNQQNFQNRLSTTQAGISAGVQQQQLNNQRYEYQTTQDMFGNHSVQVIDKQTGQVMNTINPNAMGQGSVVGTPGTTGSYANMPGTAAKNLMQHLGIQQDVPLAQAVQAYGLDPIINAIIQNEGGSIKGVQNNPGNIKFRGLPGQVDSGIQASDGGTFASYASPTAGRAAIGAIVTNAANGKSSSYGAAPTLVGFANKYTNTTPTSPMGSTASTISALPTATNSNFANSNEFQQLPEQYKGTIASILNYQSPIPGGKIGNYYRQIATTIDPNFDAGKYEQIQKVKQDFQNGSSGSGAAITAANTAIKHLQELNNSFNKLGNTNVSFWNSIKNTANSKVNAPTLKSVQTELSAVTEELRKVYAGAGGGSQQELEDWKKSFHSNMTPDEMQGVIHTGLNLLQGKTQSLAERYKSTVGTDYPIFDAESQKILQRLNPSGTSSSSDNDPLGLGI